MNALGKKQVYRNSTGRRWTRGGLSLFSLVIVLSLLLGMPVQQAFSASAGDASAGGNRPAGGAECDYGGITITRMQRLVKFRMAAAGQHRLCLLAGDALLPGQ